ncbi:MAG: hypothetical protein U0794_02755 [Isosphaeraceae bacterium]
MAPAEIVASLKELCLEKGPRLSTDEIVGWIERQGGFESNAELIRFAKKMKARQYARMLEYEDPETGLRIKRLWSFYDPVNRQRYYADILEMPESRRRMLIRQYSRFIKQLRTVRRAMADYFAGQQFFEFYPGDSDSDLLDIDLPPGSRLARGCTPGAISASGPGGIAIDQPS